MHVQHTSVVAISGTCLSDTALLLPQRRSVYEDFSMYERKQKERYLLVARSVKKVRGF